MKNLWAIVVLGGFFGSFLMIPGSLILSIWVDIRWLPMILVFVITTCIFGWLTQEL